jgi:N-acetylmuramoyl-L-alanine amidase
VPLSETLPYRAEQTLNPPRLVITLFGAVDRTDLIKYDTLDPLVRQVRWRQVAPDTVELVIDPKFDRWWGFDVRYEGTTLVVEIRKPWRSQELRGMVIALDPGHGGSDRGATGPHETVEKDANLLIAREVKKMLERAGAKPFLTREKDIDVSLYERPRIAWDHNARLFVSIHCNASGESENPVWTNGFSTYWYQPQSQAFADAIHDSYAKNIGLPDHGLYYADLAVCRMTQMPAVLTEQAYIIVPEQEDLIFDPAFQRKAAVSILNGIRAFLAKQAM